MINNLTKSPSVLAVFHDAPKENGRMLDNKEQTAGFVLVVPTPEGLTDAVTVRVWMSRSSSASMVYASIWVHGPHGTSFYAAGHGSAGGYGYHKQSQAIADAIKSAGAKLYGTPYNCGASDFTKPFDFGGTGESAYLDIFAALAKAAGHDVTGCAMVSM